MATWKDGAAYAPVERPDGFATPVADPLPAGAPYQPGTPGPMTHPSGFAPLPPQPPLGQLGREQVGERDPRDAFTVASSLITAGPGAPHLGGRDPRTPFPSTAQPALETAPPPPTGPPLDLPPPQGAPVLPGYPSRGLAPRPKPPATDAQRGIARVAGALCFVGFLITGTAPFMLVASGALGLATKRMAKTVGWVALSVGGAGLLLQLLLERWQYAPFSFVWTVTALGCAIAFMISASRST